jgi:hydroxyacylglutathione hydrolase
MMTNGRIFLGVLIGLAALSLHAAEAAKITDAESASHGGDAARHQIVDTYKFPGFEVVQVNLPVLSHYSYILASEKNALIVDPDRDITFYLGYAAANDLTIKGVFLTHSHADFVAGHRELVKAVNCPIYQSAASKAEYPIEGLTEGSSFAIGAAVVRILETPGHTPDGMCGVVSSGSDDRVGKAVFTGDTLFIGSVGRPDLLEGTLTAATLASKAFDTWTTKLAKLADSVTVLPAHGAGSLCGAHLSDKPSSTIGDERAANPYLQHKNRNEFIMAILRELPETPQYFTHNAAMNRQGPPLVDWNAPMPAEAKPDAVLMDPARYALVDIRDAAAYAADHIRNSVNIGLRGRLETWVGIMIPWDVQTSGRLILVGSTDELKEALFRLHRIGYKAGILTLQTWKAAKLPTTKIDMLKPADLFAVMQKGQAPVVVDVRLPSEWMGLRIGEVVNFPLNRLAELSAKLDPTQPVVTVCNSAYRSTMAIGVLEAKGFQQVTSLAGGSEAWVSAGLPVYGADVAGAGTGATSAPAAPRREIRLADRIGPDELARLAADLPGTFDLVDIRPADQFADYHVPAARNVDIADLINNPSFLAGASPLIIVDRDGSLAMQAAGILSQKTQRPIKALHGGLEAYWSRTELERAVREVPLPPRPGSGAAPPVAPSSPAGPPIAPPAPKKKSAGC